MTVCPVDAKYLRGDRLKCPHCGQPMVGGFKHLDLEIGTHRRYWLFLSTRPEIPPSRDPHSRERIQFHREFAVWVGNKCEYESAINFNQSFDHQNRRKGRNGHGQD